MSGLYRPGNIVLPDHTQWRTDGASGMVLHDRGHRVEPGRLAPSMSRDLHAGACVCRI